MVIKLRKIGVRYIVSSCADITGHALDRELDYLDTFESGLAAKYQALYTATIGNRKHADIKYRRNLFLQMSDICRSNQINFGITWEPDENNESIAEDYSYGADSFFESLE